jgi:AraC-like DNA-binding protein
LLVVVLAGRIELLAPRGTWRVLQGHMMFIPAGRAYVAHLPVGAQLAVVHLDPAATPWDHGGCWASRISALGREMVLYALRWPRERDPDDPVAASFFSTLGLLCREWFGNERMLWLPHGDSRQVQAAIDHVMGNLDEASIERAAAAAHLSPRTLRRRFQIETGMTWRRFVRDARMLRAVELLAAKDAKIGDVAMAVGFSSQGAFTEAFTETVGHRPRDYQRQRAA